MMNLLGRLSGIAYGLAPILVGVLGAVCGRIGANWIVDQMNPPNTYMDGPYGTRIALWVLLAEVVGFAIGFVLTAKLIVKKVSLKLSNQK